MRTARVPAREIQRATPANVATTAEKRGQAKLRSLRENLISKRTDQTKRSQAFCQSKQRCRVRVLKEQAFALAMLGQKKINRPRADPSLRTLVWAGGTTHIKCAFGYLVRKRAAKSATTEENSCVAHHPVCVCAHDARRSAMRLRTVGVRACHPEGSARRTAHR